VLFVHELHSVVGKEAKAFEAAYRDGWMPALADGDDARLLWYLDLAHGGGLSYRVVTITAVADGRAWQRLAERLASGDLRAWARDLDRIQHRSEAKVLTPLPWSDQEPRLDDVQVEAIEHEAVLYMEDTMWPFPGRLADYIEAAGKVYAPALSADGAHMRMHVELALRTMPGAGRYPEVVLLQKLGSLPRLVRLLTTDIPEEVTGPGSWMHEALELRDQWRSRLLRTATWSPRW
jgi:hypothetical protein